ncbi:hypothetical protein GALMADRAFT_159072 [Galerina marginata CBS 339.88]|uniref:Uncharacterized protein n=1 Tax=Galerina marginata (strain CBS 339.88) TaxID=685588 RepID=A0A067SQZ6_GALM3|nr:hypothetical protein GALMADRAFT_159072 [Galerina marginata CBS 339.88]
MDLRCASSSLMLPYSYCSWTSGVGRVCRTEEDGNEKAESGGGIGRSVSRFSCSLDLDADTGDVDEELMQADCFGQVRKVSQTLIAAVHLPHPFIRVRFRVSVCQSSCSASVTRGASFLLFDP